ncbi:MAG: Glycosyl transferase group 1 [Candidatus Giovannonibacteria bacterium GW2011_GWC2_43_8]|nr:MAG: Glycosyl transferase group 1 [Candidatus Giovannonibacteria bacterium GW2011_GWC2_43_8]OGF69839.1 MAG: hypothetical protein A3C76_01095 [Candidatus Giovannonibacteria bacterium RIFCSPHIGHO2_02_FULL_44_51]
MKPETRNMRILFITSKLNFKTAGGSIEELDLLMQTLQNLGNDVKTVTAFSANNVIPEKRPYEVIEEQITSPRLLGIAWQLYKILKKYEKMADIFHIDGHIFLYGAGLYKLLGGRVSVAAYFNYYLMCWEDTAISLTPLPKENIFIRAKKKIRWLIEKYIGMPLANRIDLFAFVSPNLKAVYEDFGLRRDPGTFVIGDLIDFQKIMRENGISEDFYLKRNKRAGPFLLFYSSRMIRGKGFDLLLHGFARVKNKENFKMVLTGTGPEAETLKKMAKDLGIEKYVEFPGWVSWERLLQYNKEADIYIQTGWKPEGTSISQLYAMAFGVPSILPGGGGLEWQARDTAIYVRNGDHDGLARAIEKLAGDYGLRATLSRNCYKRIREDSMDYRKQIPIWNEKLWKLAKK